LKNSGNHVRFSKKSTLDNLISTTKLLNYPKIKKLLEEYPESYVIDAVRIELNKVREMILASDEEGVNVINTSPGHIEDMVDVRVRTTFQPGIRRAVNATGIILHTTLGRAPFAKAAQESLRNAIKNYCTLAINVQTGQRGDRYKHVDSLLCYLTGAESACVVNNNAAAVLLVLNTLSEGKEVIISRGELIESSEAFRIPDIIKRSGVEMVEIGTTNRTHLFDYTNAITENTGMILLVNTSNYKIIGFTKQAPVDELNNLCGKHNVPLVFNLGSGFLIDFTKYNLPYEPTVQESIKAGVDIVTFSGDKILGGPQCGIIAGKKEYIDRIKKSPLCRALRCCKMTYASLEATLKLYLNEDTLCDSHPVIHMATLPLKTITSRSRRFVEKLRPFVPEYCDLKIIKGASQMGSGSLPGEIIPTKLVAVNPKKISADEFSLGLRKNEPPIFTRIVENQVLFDFRTIHKSEISSLIDGVITALKES